MSTTVTREFKKTQSNSSIDIENNILNIGTTSIPLKKINSVSVILFREGEDEFFNYDDYKKYSGRRSLTYLLIVLWVVFLSFASYFVSNEVDSKIDAVFLIFNDIVAYGKIDIPKAVFTLILAPFPVWAGFVIWATRKLENANKRRRYIEGKALEPVIEKRNNENSEFHLEIVTSSGKQQLLAFHDFKLLNFIKAQILNAMVEDDQNQRVVFNYDKSTNNYVFEEHNIYGDINIRNDYQGLDQNQIERLFSELKPSLEKALKKAHEESDKEIHETLEKLTSELKQKNPKNSILKEVVKKLSGVSQFTDLADLILQIFSI